MDDNTVPDKTNPHENTSQVAYQNYRRTLCGRAEIACIQFFSEGMQRTRKPKCSVHSRMLGNTQWGSRYDRSSSSLKGHHFLDDIQTQRSSPKHNHVYFCDFFFKYVCLVV